MPDNNKSMEKLSRLLGVLDEEHLSKEDFVTHFEQVVSFVKQMMDRNEQTQQMLEQTYSALLNKTSGDNEIALNDLKKQTDDLFVGERVSKMEEKISASVRKEMDAQISKIGQKMATVRDGAPGPRGPQGPGGSPDTARMIRDKLESLEEGEKLPIDAIEGLKEKLEERNLGGTGGGTSTMGVKYAMGRLVTSETPTGDVDGVNTAYTLTQPPQAILSFYINGQFIHPAEYTLAGGTITFTTALPASLSGTGFTITYV